MTRPVSINVRAARGMRLLATTMRFVADELAGTPHEDPLRREADLLVSYAGELEDVAAAPRLELVT